MNLEGQARPSPQDEELLKVESVFGCFRIVEDVSGHEVEVEHYLESRHGKKIDFHREFNNWWKNGNAEIDFTSYLLEYLSELRPELERNQVKMT